MPPHSRDQHQPEAALKKAAQPQRQRGNEDVGQIIDDEIEALAGEPGQDSGNVRHPRQGAVKTIDQQRDPEPNKQRLPVRREGRTQGKQGTNDAQRREAMDCRGWQDGAHSRALAVRLLHAFGYSIGIGLRVFG